METYFIEQDIRLCCIEASSFPDGVLAAHQTLHAKFAYDGKRRFFGISRPEKTMIIYKAAVEMLTDEKPEEFGGEPGLIRRGEYTGLLIKNFRNDIPAIGRAFREILTDPRIDPEGYCVELYTSIDNVRCMVRLKSKT